MSDAGKVEELRGQARAAMAPAGWRKPNSFIAAFWMSRATTFEARHMIGVLRLQQNRAAEALEMLEPLLADAPAHADIRTHHGTGASGTGPAVMKHWLISIVRLLLKPDNALTLLYRGNLLLEAGRAGDALASYDRLLAIAPGYDEAWFRRGGALWLMERYEDALDSYRKALAHQSRPFWRRLQQRHDPAQVGTL